MSDFLIGVAPVARVALMGKFTTTAQPVQPTQLTYPLRAVIRLVFGGIVIAFIFGVIPAEEREPQVMPSFRQVDIYVDVHA